MLVYDKKHNTAERKTSNNVQTQCATPVTHGAQPLSLPIAIDGGRSRESTRQSAHATPAPALQNKHQSQRKIKMLLNILTFSNIAPQGMISLDTSITDEGINRYFQNIDKRACV